MITNDGWLSVPNFPWYEISKGGQIRSKHPRRKTPLLLKPTLSHGYQTVKLYRQGERQTHTIAQLVMKTFVGSPPIGKEVNHRNGNKTDNRLENLEYVTRSENQLHANRTGLRTPQRGSKHGMSKLTEEIVREIRALPKEVTHSEIANIYHVDRTTIREVRQHISWRHV